MYGDYHNAFVLLQILQCCNRCAVLITLDCTAGFMIWWNYEPSGEPCPLLLHQLSAICLTTGPYHLPERILHTVRSSASTMFIIFSCPYSYPVAAYVFFLAFPLLLSFRLYFLQWRILKTFTMQNVTNSVALPPLPFYAGFTFFEPCIVIHIR